MSKVLTPKRVRELSAREYLQEMADTRYKNNVRHVRFVSPKIGKADFGHFEVTYKKPILVLTN